MTQSLLSIATLLMALISSVKAAAISLEDVSRLNVEDRRTLYANLRPEQLANPSDYLSLLEQGLQNTDTFVRRNAAGQTAMALVGLQRLKREGQTLPIDVSRLPALQNALKRMMSDPDPQVRSAISLALAFSDTTTAEIETILLEQWRREDNAELRIANLKTLVDAGYSSDRLTGALISSLSDSQRRAREQASRLITRIKPTGALPQLAVLLADKEMARDFVVEAIGSYGKEAQSYLPALEKLLSDPSIGGTLPNRIRLAITAISNPQPPSTPAESQIKAVSLVDKPTPTPDDSTPIPDKTPPSTQSQSVSQPSPTITSGTKLQTQPKSNTPIIVGILLLLAVAAGFVLYRRKS